MRGTIASLLLILSAAVSCSSSTTETVDGGGTTGGAGGAGGAANAGCGGTSKTLVGLVVKNVDAGCTIDVNGAVTFDSSVQTICQEPATLNLVATANAGFMLGSNPWHDTATQDGASATVTLTSGTKCIWVCCPGAGTTCPTTDQCP